MNHDAYGKELFAKLLGTRWRHQFCKEERSVRFGAIEAHLDGVIYSDDGSVECAVQIEASNFKQMRGAIFDLACHHAPKKFLVVIRGNNEIQNKSDGEIRSHCLSVWQQLKPLTPESIELAILAGAGTSPDWKEDESRLIAGLKRLGVHKDA